MLNNVLLADGEAMPRQRIEAAIEALIALLDAADGDCDCEPYLADTDSDAEFDEADIEPSLGWTERPDQVGRDWHGATANRWNTDFEHDLADLG